MDRRHREQARLACQISIGLMAGIFSVVPVVSASPVQDTTGSVVTASGGFTVTPQAGQAPKGGTRTEITSTTTNNVIPWKDFSVGEKEQVRFDQGNKTNNYLNVVTGQSTSQIAGSIEGGKDVYIVNPHGVVFGKDAKVNVGNLYVSTEKTKDAVDAFNNSKTGADVINAGKAAADVVNLGTLQAAEVQVSGANIRFLKSENVLDTSSTTANPVVNTNVTLNATGYIHVGNTNGTNAGYTAGGTTKTIDYYQLVNDAKGLRNMSLTGNYMLSQNITAGSFTPIGTSSAPFTGKFDGMFYEISGLKVSTANQEAGLFGAVNNARVENLGVVGANVASSHKRGYVGSIVGVASGSSVLNNLYSEAGTVNGKIAGGLVGTMNSGTQLKSSYNTSSVKTNNGRGGGLVGELEDGAKIINAYNTGSVSGSSNVYGIAYNPAGGATVDHVYNATDGLGLTSKADSVSQSYNFSSTASSTNIDIATAKNISTYENKGGAYATGWTSSDISADGTTDTPWRIYEGQSTPLLTAFFKGNVTADYNYNFFKTSTDTTASSDGLKLAGITSTANNTKDITDATYNAQYLKIASSSDATKVGTASDVTFSGNVTSSDSNLTINTTGIRNVAVDSSGNAVAQSLIASGQHGYNIIGGGVKLAKRKVAVSGNASITKEYDGSPDGTAAFAKALTGGSANVNIAGVIPGDTVSLANVTATYSDKNVGTGKTVNVAVNGTAGLTGASAGNYDFDATGLTNMSVTGDITPRMLYVTMGSTGDFDKPYDGTTTVTDANAAASKNLTLDTSRVVTGDHVALDAANTAIDYYNGKTAVKDANATTNTSSYDIRYTNLKLTGDSSGDDSGNYQLVVANTNSKTGYDVLYNGYTKQTGSGYLSATGHINQRVIDPSSFQVVDKTTKKALTAEKDYDGTSTYSLPTDSKGNLTAEISPTGTSSIANSGLVTGENIIFTPTGTANFTQSDGTTKTSQVSNAALVAVGLSAAADPNATNTTTLSNYKWGSNGSGLTSTGTYDVTIDGKINPRTITVLVNQTGNIDKTYDGTNLANNPSNPPTTTLNANAFEFGKTGSIVTYDPNTINSQNTDHQIITDSVNGKTPTMTITPTYASADVARDSNWKATDQAINYDVLLSGDNAENYKLVSAPATSGGSSTGVAASTTAGTNGLELTFAGSTTGTQKGIINPIQLNAAFNNSIDKTYDGTTNVDMTKVSGTLSSGILTADQGKIQLDTTNLKAAYHSENVDGNVNGTITKNSAGQTNWIDYSGVALKDTSTGSKAKNYDIASTAEGAGKITKLTLKAGDFDYTYDTIMKEYDGTNAVTDAASHIQTVKVKQSVSAKQEVFKDITNGNNIDYTSKVSATYADSNSHGGTSQNIDYTVTINKDNSGNFDWSQLPNGIVDTKTNATTGTITARKIQAHVVDSNLTKTYDADPTATAASGKTLISYTYAGSDPTVSASQGLVGSDTDASTGTYVTKGTQTADADASVSKGKDVLYTLKTSAKDQSNYEIVSVSKNGTTTTTTPITTLTGDGTINKRGLKVTFNNVTKSYDGTGAVTDAMITGALGLDDGANQAVIKKDGLLTDFNTATTGSTQKPIQGAYQDSTNQFNAQNGYTVAYSNLLAALGTHAKNYNISNLSNTENNGTIYGTGDITKLALNGNFVFDFNTISKEYDGNANVAHTDVNGNNVTAESYINNAYVNNNGTQIKLSNIKATKATYASANSNNSSTPQTVTYDLTFGNLNLNNYIVANGTTWTNTNTANNTTTTLTYNNGAFKATTTGTITPRKVVASVVNHNLTKTYDGTTTAQKNGTTPFISYEHYVGPNKTGGAGSGLVASDVDASTGVYGATADASQTTGDKTVTYTLGINNASNYEIVDGATGSVVQKTLQDKGTIDKRKVLISFTDTRKTWDGTTAATGDLLAPTVTFDDSNKAGNTDGKSGIITNAALGAAAAFQNNLATDPGKYGTYSQTNVTQNGQADTVTYTLAELFRTYDASGNLINDYGKNYDFSAVGNNTGKGYIDQLVITNPNAFHFNFNPITKEYDNTYNVGYTDRTTGKAVTAASFVKDSYVTVNGKNINLGGWTATGTYQSKDSSNKAQPVTYTVNFGSNAGSNFTLGSFTRNGQNTAADPTLKYSNGVLTATTEGTITPRTVYASLKNSPTQVTKTYNGLTDILQNGSSQNIMGDVQMNGLLTGTANDDGVRLNTAASQAQYKDKNAGSNKDIIYNLSLTGTNASQNYKIVDANQPTKVITSLTSTGTGNIDKAHLSIDFGRVEKVYDTSADVTTTSPGSMSGGATQKTTTTIAPTLFGFVAADKTPSLAMSSTGITGEYATWDTKNNTAVADANVNRDTSGNVIDKGVQYKNIAQAFNSMAGSAQYQSLLQNYDLTGGYIAPGSASGASAKVLSANNGIADTVYFNEAAAKGQIKPLALTQGALIDQWNRPITKVYDGTADVKNPTQYMTLYVADPTNTSQPLTINGKTFAVGYTLAQNGAIYKDASGNAQINQTGNTPVSVEYSVNGLSKTSLNNFSTPLTFQNTYTSMAIGNITPRTIYGTVTKKTDVNKTYDSTKNLDAAGLANLAVTHSETDANGNTVTNATGDGILAKDAALGVTLTKSGSYDNADATIKPGAQATNARNINYTMTLNDPTGLGNYVLDPNYPNGYTATGDIYRAKIKVHSDAKTSTEGSTPSGFTGKTTGWYNDADHTAYLSNGGDSNITWNIKPGQDATKRGTYGIYGWYLGTTFPVQQVSQTTDPTTGAVLTTTETITNPVTNVVITRVTDAKTGLVTYQDAAGKALPASSVIGWFNFSNDPTKTSDPDWASSGLASYALVGSQRNGLYGTNYYFEQDPSDLTVNAVSHGGGGGGGTVIPSKPVTPVTPVTPVSPVTPTNPTTPTNPSSPITPSSVPDVSSDVNAAKQFVPNANAYNNASHDDFGSVTRSGSAGLEYASGGINVLSETGTPNVSTSEVDNAAIGLQNSGSIVNLSGGDAMEVDASRIDLTGGDSFTITGDTQVQDSTAAIESTGAQTHESSAAIETAEATTKDAAASIETADATTKEASASVETTDLQSTTDGSWLFGDEAPASEKQSETSSSGDSEASLFANPQDDDAAAAQSAISVKTAEDTENADDSDAEDDKDKDKDQESSDHADDSSIGIESEGAGVNVA